MTRYILKDRTTGNNYLLQITDGELSITTTLLGNYGEPVLQDTINTSDYWRLFINDGQLGIEVATGVGIIHIQLQDTSTVAMWNLLVSDGQLNISQIIKTSVSRIILRKSRIEKSMALNSPYEVVI